MENAFTCGVLLIMKVSFWNVMLQSDAKILHLRNFLEKQYENTDQAWSLQQTSCRFISLLFVRLALLTDNSLAADLTTDVKIHTCLFKVSLGPPQEACLDLLGRHHLLFTSDDQFNANFLVLKLNYLVGDKLHLLL